MISSTNPNFHCGVHYPQYLTKIRLNQTTFQFPEGLSHAAAVSNSTVSIHNIPKTDHNHVLVLSSDVPLSKRGQLGTV